MLIKLLTKVFGSRNDRTLRRMRKVVNIINAVEPEMEKLSDEELKGKTAEFRARLEKGEVLENLIPEAFAVVREASKRVFGMRHFDVQLLGGMVLNERCIAEMRTGEGKTLTATLPAYLNALTGKGVHVVTVNDYLAQRDAENNRPLFEFLGLTVGINLPGMPAPAKREAYAADITYGTNNEYGFDYLRDNMAFSPEERVQRKLHYALVDEVDSILIDEARTPLIISGPAEDSSEMYKRVNKIIPHLIRQEKEDSETFQGEGHFSVDEKSRQVNLTERGLVLIEELLVKEGIMDEGESLYSPANIMLMHHVTAALRAHALFTRDVDYIVKDGEVIIVDEHTGRTMQGRRWSDGLHQAVEAKEGVQIQNENQTLASITFQNYFRLYDKLSGMTGTAMTEAEEFGTIYNLDIVEIPTNRPNQREDHHDVVYKTEAGKFRAVIQQVKECHEKGQPVLVGTVSIEKNELLSHLLQREGIQHNLLNAKNHEKEAEIVAQAGKLGAVTVATNMAGRGTDIMLGGNAEYLSRADLVKAGYSEEVIVDATGYADTDNEDILAARKLFAERMAYHKAIIKEEAEKVRAAGGLFIIGTERHESRRIDNQLRGRAGRQGDPGETRFYISLEDDLMRLFGGDRIQNMMEKFDLDEDTPIENKMLTRAIENAQTTVESRNFQSRKSVLEYDDVMNKQREIIYAQRRQVLDGLDIKETVLNMMHTSVSNHVALAFGENQHLDAAQYHEMLKGMEGIYFAKGAVEFSDEEIPSKTQEDFDEAFIAAAEKTYEAKEQEVTTPIMRELERVIMLRVVDEYWMDHIDAMDDLKQGVRLQGYGNNNPVDVYKRESLDMFEEMVSAIQDETVRRLYSVRLRKDEEVKRERVAKATVENVGGDGTTPKKQPVKKTVKIGRNDPCPCGSGLKWKKCTCKEYHPDL